MCNRISIRWNVSMLLLVFGLCVCGVRTSAESEDLNKHAVAMWNFDDGAGTALMDSSGNGHHGSIVGATWIEGSWGRALRFDRDKGDHVKVPDSPALHVQPPYTLGVWFRTTSSKNNALYLIKNGASGTGCGLYFYSDSLALYHDAMGVDKELYHKGYGSKIFPDGTWHHVVGTCGHGKLRLFLDGQVVAERDVPKDLKLDYSGTGGASLGYWAGAGSLDGMMGKAYILKSALSEEDVKTLYAEEWKRFSGNIEVKKAEKGPFIDGKLDDVCWPDQSALTNFTVINYESTRAKKQTEAYLCYDNSNIYVGIICEEPNIEGISASRIKRDSRKIQSNDCVEVFIFPRDGLYYQFLINPVNSLRDLRVNYELGEEGPGGRFDEFNHGVSWNCLGLKSAVYQGKDYWSIEMSIPFSQIGGVPRPRDDWGLNIARREKQLGELSTFSPLFESFDQPGLFSRIRFQKDKAIVARAAKKFVAINLTPGLEEAKARAKKEVRPVVFVNNYLERGYPTTLPKKGELTETLELFASRGEYEPVTFSVRAGGKAIKGLKVRMVGDLKSENGSVIPKENVEIRVVERWKRQLNTRKIMWMERYLQKKEAVDIRGHTTRRFWLTVHVPEDAAGGIYRSKVVITAGEETLKTLDLEIEVLPFKLMSGEGMGYFMYLPEWGFPRELRTAEYLNKVFVDMREHGMTTASLYMSPVVVDGKVDVDKHLPWNFPFAGMMDVLRDTKLLGPGVPAIWLGPDTCSPAAWKDVLDESRKRNWPELVLYLQDEPGDEERNENARRLFRQVDEFKETYPEYKNVRTTTSLGGKGIEALGHLYDIWITGAGGDQEYLIKQARKANEMGKLLWSYDCALSPEDAESARYYFGLWCWKTGMKGAALWAYSSTQDTNETRWDYIEKNLENTELQCSFVWPSADGPIPSVGWEAVREGVDDHKYLSTLSKMIEKAKAAGHEAAAQRAAGILEQITDKVRAEGYREGMKGGRATGWRHGDIYHRTSPQPEITYGDYNKFRYRMAQEIIKLRKEMEE